jgi:hypothetical protein
MIGTPGCKGLEFQSDSAAGDGWGGPGLAPGCNHDGGQGPGAGGRKQHQHGRAPGRRHGIRRDAKRRGAGPGGGGWPRLPSD